MSSPSGKPFDPFDLSPYAPKRARERSTFDEAPVGNDDHEGGEEAAVALAYVPRAAMRPGAADEHAVDLDAGEPARPRPDAAAAQPAEKPAASAADASAVDPDLARLESSLQWLQREGAGGRLPRAVPLPPVSGIRPVSPDGPRPRGEQFINGVRVPPSLAPARLRPPPPMRARRDNLRGPLRVLLASVIAAPIAYYFSVGNFASPSEPAGRSALASFASRLVASSEFPISKEKLRPGEAEAYNTVVSSRNKLVAQPPAVAPLVATPVRVETVTVVPPSSALPSPALPSPAPDQATPAAAKPERELDPEAIKLLLQQGEQFVGSGDLVTARLVYRKAAEAGNAAAALALGATYDPVVLAKIGVRGMGADIEKARSWYEKAKEFGSPDAPRRLEMLANR
jgi:TPR repeat protein